MGMHWGNMMTNLRGVVSYSLSPYEQKPFAGALTKGVPNMVRRVREQFFRVVPPFIIGWAVYDWANKEHERLLRKNPKDYACDE